MDIWEELEAIQEKGYIVHLHWNERVIIKSNIKHSGAYTTEHVSGTDFLTTIYHSILQFDERTTKYSKQSSIT